MLKILVGSALLAGVMVSAANAKDATTDATERASAAQPSPVEDIFILRSVRETRATPTDFCAKDRTRLDAPTFEDNYTFRSVAVRDRDGFITNASVESVGGIHGCFGRTANAAAFDFYGEFAINGIAGKAFGECRSGKPDFPEAGLKLFSCFFELFDLPPAYAGGQLTTNSVNSANITGEVSEPKGYTQASIATVRLWRRRGG